MFKLRCSAIGEVMTKGFVKTPKTYVENWYKEQLYGRKKEVKSKYLTKGIEQEENAIALVADHYDLGMIFKNEEEFENEYITGTPDLILKYSIRDIKCSWDCFTFPLFEDELPNKNYYWQMQGYMELTNKNVALIDFVLMDSLEDEIDKACFYEFGKDYSMEQYESIRSKMVYSDFPNKLRVKTFEVKRDKEAIKLVYKRVEECREYLDSIKLK